MAGRIAFSGRRSGVALPWTGPRGHMRNTSSRSEETCRGFATATFSCASNPPACRGHDRADGFAHRTGRDRCQPQRRTARACNWIRFAASGFNQGRAREAFQERPPSPSGCLSTFDVAVSRTLPGRFGRSPYFRHQRLLLRSLRPRDGTRRINSLYQCSVTVGAAPDRTCLWAPSLPEW